MPIEMTERLERALKLWAFDARGDALDAFQQELLAAYREARDRGTFEVRNPEALRPETPLTVERLVRVLRQAVADRDRHYHCLAKVADALEAEEE